MLCLSCWRGFSNACRVGHCSLGGASGAQGSEGPYISLTTFSTSLHSTIGVSRRLATSPWLTSLENVLNVREWSWISSTRMTLDSSLEAHGPAFRVTPLGSPPLMPSCSRAKIFLALSGLVALK